MMKGIIRGEYRSMYTKDIDIVKQVFETAMCAMGLRNELHMLRFDEIDDILYACIDMYGIRFPIYRSEMHDGYCLDVVAFMYQLAKDMCDPLYDCTLSLMYKNIIRSFLRDPDSSKVLVIENDDADSTTLFVRWMDNKGYEVLVSKFDMPGEGPSQDYNEHRHGLCGLELTDGYGMYPILDVFDKGTKYIRHYVPVLQSALRCYTYFNEDDEIYLDHKPDIMFDCERISDVCVVMFTGEYLDSFADRYMRDMHSEMFIDIPDDDGEIDRKYEECMRYNPEAFEYWKDYYCRKRCMIDTGAGCNSNICKRRVTQFINVQYDCYKVKKVKG